MSFGELHHLHASIIVGLRLRNGHQLNLALTIFSSILWNLEENGQHSMLHLVTTRSVGAPIDCRDLYSALIGLKTTRDMCCLQ
jgi:hypothetical protein